MALLATQAHSTMFPGCLLLILLTDSSASKYLILIPEINIDQLCFILNSLINHETEKNHNILNIPFQVVE